MFKPNMDTPENKIGTFQVLKCDLNALSGTITKGSTVLVTGYGDHGYDVQDLESKEKMNECGFDIFF